LSGAGLRARGIGLRRGTEARTTVSTTIPAILRSSDRLLVVGTPPPRTVATKHEFADSVRTLARSRTIANDRPVAARGTNLALGLPRGAAARTTRRVAEGPSAARGAGGGIDEKGNIWRGLLLGGRGGVPQA